jgi:precorrin-2 dehydrogenase/sirohydrochlorin ferrochelatase
MKLYPVMLRVAGKRAVVIGGGLVAMRKIKDLLDCGALVTVISPQIDESIHNLCALYPDKIKIINRDYKRRDIAGAFIIFSATDNERINRDVSRDARKKNIIINTADDPENCTFFVPSWFNRKGIIIAVSTSGISPALSARFRRKIEEVIPDSIEDILAALEKTRYLLKNNSVFESLTPQQRGRILKQIVNNDDLLEELVTCYASDTLEYFIKNLQSNDTESSK